MFLSAEKKDQKYWPGWQVNLQFQIKFSTFYIHYHTLIKRNASAVILSVWAYFLGFLSNCPTTFAEQS